MREVLWKMKIRTNRGGGMTKGENEGVQECDDCGWKNWGGGRRHTEMFGV
jgi:hypothetical protein